MHDSGGDKYPEHDAVVDARGLPCPMPVLKARLESNRMVHGQILHVLSTDAASQRDFRTFALQTGHELVAEAVEEGVYGFWLRIQRLGRLAPGQESSPDA